MLLLEIFPFIADQKPKYAKLNERLDEVPGYGCPSNELNDW